MKRRPILAALAAAAIAGSALSACTAPYAPDQTGTPTSTTGTTTLPDPIPPVTDDFTGVGPALMQLGETYDYPSGISVTVEQLPDGVITEDYLFTEPLPGTPYPVFKYTITNNGTEPFDPTGATQTVNYGADGIAPMPLFGAVEEAGYWQGVILPGQSQTQTVAYNMPVGQDLTMTFSPDWASMPVIYTNLPT